MRNTNSFLSTSVINLSETSVEGVLTPEKAVALCEPYIQRAIRRLEDRYNCQADDFRNDLEQEGRLAVLQALANFDASNGAAFTSYAHPYFYFAMAKSLVTELKHGASLESYDVLNDEEEYIQGECENLSADETYDADYGFTCNAQREKCEQLLARVKDPIDRQIIRRAFGLEDGFEASDQAIAFFLGVCAERVRQRRNRAMQQLQPAA